jgi:hypothetical protein
MNDKPDFLIGTQNLKRMGRLIQRLSLGTTKGIIYAELRERDNKELSVEMFSSDCRIWDPLLVIGELPPAFCVLSSLYSDARTDDIKTCIAVTEWIESSGIPVLAAEVDGSRKEAIFAERAFMESMRGFDEDAYDWARDIARRFEVNGPSNDPEHYIGYQKAPNQWGYVPPSPTALNYLKSFGVTITETEEDYRFTLPEAA